MSTRAGRPQRATDEQRAEVLRRAAARESNRAIAEAVFGDARYRGRVERIRRQPAHEDEPATLTGRPVELRLDHDAPPADAAYWRELVSQSRRDVEQRLQRGAHVPPRELAALLKLEQHVANLEQYERMRALTRRQPSEAGRAPTSAREHDDT